MTDITEKYGRFGNDLLDALTQEAKRIIGEMLEPILILKNFEHVEVLTLDEACSVLRLDKRIVRDACSRGEVPHQKIGRSLIFPKYTLAKYLCGEWRK